MQSSFIGQCYQPRAKGAIERLKIPTAHEGKTAANCSIPAITLAANKAATRAAAPNKRIVKTTGEDAFVIKKLTQRIWTEFDQASQENLIL
jgi:hypothetical protein